MLMITMIKVLMLIMIVMVLMKMIMIKRIVLIMMILVVMLILTPMLRIRMRDKNDEKNYINHDNNNPNICIRNQTFGTQRCVIHSL